LEGCGVRFLEGRNGAELPIIVTDARPCVIGRAKNLNMNTSILNIRFSSVGQMNLRGSGNCCRQGDCATRNMQHMSVVFDFCVKSCGC
jgi:hypothetical protein